MKKYALLYISLYISLFLPVSAHAVPRMELSPDVWNMGEVYQWANPFTQITIRNKGDQDLIIQDIKASCGCTAAVISEKTIKPGKEGTLRIEFSSFGYRGRIKREVTLYTNDPAAAVKSIPIRGTVKEDKASVGVLEPDTIDLGVVAPYETRHFSFNIRNRGNRGLPVAGIELPPGCSHGSAAPSSVPVMGMVPCKVAYKPAKLSGPIDEEVVIKLSNEQKELRLRLVGYVAETGKKTDAVIITPSSFLISPAAANTGLEVGLKNDGAYPVLVEGAESSLDWLSADVPSFEVQPGLSGSIKLSLDPARFKEGKKGYLYIRIAVPVVLEPVAGK